MKTNNKTTLTQLSSLIEAAHSPFHCCAYLAELVDPL